MRWINKSELSSSSMAGNDAAPITDVSTGQDKKFTLSGIADWILNKFTMSLGGSTRTVKSAIDSIKTTNDAQGTLLSSHTSEINTINTKLNNGNITPKYKAGDTVTFSNSIACAGFITGGTKRIWCLIPLPKSANGLTASFSFAYAQSLSLRGTNGYVGSTEYYDHTSFSMITTRIDTNGVMLQMVSDDTLVNATNNTPVAVSLKGTITFS